MKYRADRRLSDREITVHSESSTQHVTLRDVSTSGMKIRCSKLFHRGTKVYIHLLGQDRGAAVIWSRGGYTGLKFDNPLTATELAAIHRPCDLSPFRSGRLKLHTGVQRFRELN